MTKKTYNPFKLWGSYIGVLVSIIVYLTIAAFVTDFMLYDKSINYAILFLFLVFGFFNGWLIHWPRFQKKNIIKFILHIFINFILIWIAHCISKQISSDIFTLSIVASLVLLFMISFAIFMIQNDKKEKAEKTKEKNK